MGEAKGTKNDICTTIAVRYRFVYENVGGGEPQLQFRQHPLIKLEVEVPEEKEDNVELTPDNVEYEDDVEYLRSLDPLDWKSQDHYKVLGIAHLREKATDEIIKVAYRKKVLKHHPDKREAVGKVVKTDDDYFMCITMAYETLGNVNKRRAYDSVDPTFDNNIPSTSDIKQDFYKTCTYYFDLNSKWSEKPHVPKFGDSNSSRQEVEHFYSFWYDFKSWREFSYEDEEDKEKIQDRDDRRAADKYNKAERLRKKKEEMARIRQLVDLAYKNDPRIAKFREEDKEKKLAARKAKEDAVLAKKQEEQRVIREALIAKQKAEEEERARVVAERQEREVLKKALKKERKALRDICKSNNYFADNLDQNLAHITLVDSMCEKLSINELVDINKKLSKNGKSAFLQVTKEHQQYIEKQRLDEINAMKQKTNTENNAPAVVMIAPDWNEDNIAVLVKAVNLFPAGTNQRWEVVANFLNQHGTFLPNTSKFTSKMVLAKAKDLQNTDFSKNNLKEVANKQAFDNFKKDKKAVLNIDESGISKKLDEVALSENGEKPKNGEIKPKIDKPEVPWTPEEQQLLEQALKTYPISTPERWDRIAECLPNRNKKDCMKRCKELMEIIRAKKAAQTTISGK